MRKVAAYALLVLLLSTTTRALAEDRNAARDSYRQATQHFNLGEYNDALTGFKAAYRNFEDPSFLFNIAQCERLLGQKADAVRAYKTYLLNAQNPANRSEVNALIDRLEDELRREHEIERTPPQGTLMPSSSPPDSSQKSPIVTTRPSDQRQPVYKKWWLWTTVGLVAAGIGVGLGLGLTQASGSSATAMTTSGTFHPF